MKRISGIALLAFFLFSCSKDQTGLLTGTYSGTFQRKFNNGSPVSAITITFTGTQFSGGSDSTYYPAICNGNYRFASDSILFQNTCTFPANFDWSLILNGNYKVVRTDDSLIFSRVIGDIQYEEDIYKLKKE